MKFILLHYILAALMFFLATGCNKDNTDELINNDQSDYPNNEDGIYQDILTPLYYNSNENDSFRNDVNKFIYYVRQEQFQHLLEDESGQIPQYTVPSSGKFGVGKGPNGTSEHHPADDLHVGNSETNVNIYAVHDGYVTTFRDAPKYRHYLSITKDITDDNGQLIGRMVTLYAHIDLDLDEVNSLIMNEQYVSKGDIVSKHLYSGTMGGPHLHFEICYYRPEDTGTETFYGFVGMDGISELTEPSSGNWLYGYWNPDVGYGFGNPKNHGLIFY